MGSGGGGTGGLEGREVGMLFCDTLSCDGFSLLQSTCGVLATTGVRGSSIDCCASSLCNILEDVEFLSFDR